MALWGETIKAGATAAFSPENGSLDLTHLTLVSGTSATVSLSPLDRPEEKFTIARLTDNIPSLRTQVLLEDATELIVDGDSEASVTFLGNIRLETFPHSSEDDEDDSDFPDMFDGEDTDESGDEDNSEDEEDWEIGRKLEALKQLSSMLKGSSKSYSTNMSSRVVDVTDEEPTVALPSKSTPKSLPAAEKSADGEESTPAESKKQPASDKKRPVAKTSTEPLTARKTTADKNEKASVMPKPVVSDNSKAKQQEARLPAPGVSRTLPGGVKYEVMGVGSGKVAGVGNKVKVRYEGRLARTGKKFDSGTLDFTLGGGEMIQGFDLGTRGMLLKEKRRIFIPARLGYGKRKVGTIPPNSDLIFEVTLVSVQ